MKKKTIFIAAIVSGLLLITNTHLQHPLGDSLFNLVGLSPWTKANQNGLHLPVILGLVILLIGIAGTVRLYRPRYPKVQSRVI